MVDRNRNETTGARGNTRSGGVGELENLNVCAMFCYRILRTGLAVPFYEYSTSNMGNVGYYFLVTEVGSI